MRVSVSTKCLADIFCINKLTILHIEILFFMLALSGDKVSVETKIDW